MEQRNVQLAATLALLFDDRAVRRHLALHHPVALERARSALAVNERCRQAAPNGEGTPS